MSFSVQLGGQSAQLCHMMMTHFNTVVFVLLNADISSFNPLYINEFFHLACYNEPWMVHCACCDCDGSVAMRPIFDARPKSN